MIGARWCVAQGRRCAPDFWEALHNNIFTEQLFINIYYLMFNLKGKTWHCYVENVLYLLCSFYAFLRWIPLQVCLPYHKYWWKQLISICFDTNATSKYQNQCKRCKQRRYCISRSLSGMCILVNTLCIITIICNPVASASQLYWNLRGGLDTYKKTGANCCLQI